MAAAMTAAGQPPARPADRPLARPTARSPGTDAGPCVLVDVAPPREGLAYTSTAKLGTCRLSRLPAHAVSTGHTPSLHADSRMGVAEEHPLSPASPSPRCCCRVRPRCTRLSKMIGSVPVSVHPLTSAVAPGIFAGGEVSARMRKQDMQVTGVVRLRTNLAMVSAPGRVGAEKHQLRALAALPDPPIYPLCRSSRCAHPVHAHPSAHASAAASSVATA